MRSQSITRELHLLSAVIYPWNPFPTGGSLKNYRFAFSCEISMDNCERLLRRHSRMLLRSLSLQDGVSYQAIVPACCAICHRQHKQQSFFLFHRSLDYRLPALRAHRDPTEASKRGACLVRFFCGRPGQNLDKLPVADHGQF